MKALADAFEHTLQDVYFAECNLYEASPARQPRTVNGLGGSVRPKLFMDGVAVANRLLAVAASAPALRPMPK